MILNRDFYNKVPLFKGWWSRRQTKGLKSDRLFKAFHLLKTEWPQKLYFYSPRLKKIPVFIGNKGMLSEWKAAKTLELVCPTNAIEVTKDAILIDGRGCIACGLCVEFTPEGLLEIPGSAEV